MISFFWLLALTNATKSPNFHEANSLIAAGLGKKRIVFPDKNGDFNHIKQVLEQEFPVFETVEVSYMSKSKQQKHCTPNLRLLQ